MSEGKAFSALQLGIAAAKEGNRELARRLLLEATKFDPKNRDSWLWLATVANSEAERALFLKQASEVAVVSNGVAQHAQNSDNESAGTTSINGAYGANGSHKMNGSEQTIASPDTGSTPATPAAETKVAWKCPLCLATEPEPVQQCPSCKAIVTLTKIDDILANEDVDQIKIQEAVDRYRLELSLREDIRLHYRLALAYLNLKEIVQSIIHLNEAIRLEPNKPVLHKLVELLKHKHLAQSTATGQKKMAFTKEGMVLVVDDSPTIRKAVTIVLEKAGYHVVTAADGLQALGKLNSTEMELNGRLPDLVFLDVAMPNMDGYQVCKIIKGNDLTKDIPVVMLSGKDGFFNKMRGRMAGSTEYITKPCNPQTLINAVKKHAKVQVA